MVHWQNRKLVTLFIMKHLWCNLYFDTVFAYFTLLNHLITLDLIRSKMLTVPYVRPFLTDVISTKMLAMLYVRQLVTGVVSAKMLTVPHVHYHQDAACVLCQAISHWCHQHQNSVHASCQMVSHWCFTMEVQVWSQGSPCGICGGKIDTGTGFSLLTSFFCCCYNLTCVPHLFIHHLGLIWAY